MLEHLGAGLLPRVAASRLEPQDLGGLTGVEALRADGAHEGVPPLLRLVLPLEHGVELEVLDGVGGQVLEAERDGGDELVPAQGVEAGVEPAARHLRDLQGRRHVDRRTAPHRQHQRGERPEPRPTTTGAASRFNSHGQIVDHAVARAPARRPQRRCEIHCTFRHRHRPGRPAGRRPQRRSETRCTYSASSWRAAASSRIRSRSCCSNMSSPAIGSASAPSPGPGMGIAPPPVRSPAGVPRRVGPAAGSTAVGRASDPAGARPDSATAPPDSASAPPDPDGAPARPRRRPARLRRRPARLRTACRSRRLLQPMRRTLPPLLTSISGRTSQRSRHRHREHRRGGEGPRRTPARNGRAPDAAPRPRRGTRGPRRGAPTPRWSRGRPSAIGARQRSDRTTGGARRPGSAPRRRTPRTGGRPTPPSRYRCRSRSSFSRRSADIRARPRARAGLGRPPPRHERRLLDTGVLLAHRSRDAPRTSAPDRGRGPASAARRPETPAAPSTPSRCNCRRSTPSPW